MLLGGIALASAVISAVICICADGFGSLAWLWLLPVGFAGSFLGLAVAAFLFLWFMCCLVRLDVPQEHDSKFYRGMTYLYIDALLALAQVRLHATGLEKTPKDGRFMLVCNHVSDADPPLLLAYFKQSQLAFISKQENASMFIVGKIMHKLMCQLVNRENDREALKTIIKCIGLIRDDEVSVAVFPEGGINDDRKLHRFRNGVFKIAQKTKVPIVVCTLKNTLQIFHNFPRLKPTDVELHLLDVLQPEQYEGLTTVQLGDMVYRMMADDLGPDLVAE